MVEEWKQKIKNAFVHSLQLSLEMNYFVCSLHWRTFFNSKLRPKLFPNFDCVCVCVCFFSIRSCCGNALLRFMCEWMRFAFALTVWILYIISLLRFALLLAIQRTTPSILFRLFFCRIICVCSYCCLAQRKCQCDFLFVFFAFPLSSCWWCDVQHSFFLRSFALRPVHFNFFLFCISLNSWQLAADE